MGLCCNFETSWYNWILTLEKHNRCQYGWGGLKEQREGKPLDHEDKGEGHNFRIRLCQRCRLPSKRIYSSFISWAAGLLHFRRGRLLPRAKETWTNLRPGHKERRELAWEQVQQWSIAFKQVHNNDENLLQATTTGIEAERGIQLGGPICDMESMNSWFDILRRQTVQLRVLGHSVCLLWVLCGDVEKTFSLGLALSDLTCVYHIRTCNRRQSPHHISTLYDAS